MIRLVKLRHAVFIAVVALACGCKENPNDYTGKVLDIPFSPEDWCSLSEAASLSGRVNSAAIVIYYDAKGCTSCQLKELGSWRTIINRIRRDSVAVDLIPIFRIDREDNDLNLALRSSGFDIPYVCDPEGLFEARNSLPRSSLHHTFLVDRSNSIVLVGTPIYNTDLWNAYVEKIEAMQQ